MKQIIQLKNTLETKNNLKGFISIITIIILLVIVVVIILTSFQISTDSLVTNKNINSFLRSRVLATSCIEIGFNKLKRDNSYTGNEEITINGDKCLIQPITGTGNTNRLIRTSSSINNTNYIIEAYILEVNPKIILNYYKDGTN